MFIPKSPDPQACTLKKEPPRLVAPTPEDLAKPGDPGCGETYELCMSKKGARYFLELIDYAEEAWIHCKERIDPEELP